MRFKKIFSLLALVAILIVPCQTASASSVSFSNFSYTSTPNSEYWVAVTSKNKDDNEQAWYVTLTGKSGFSSTIDCAMFTSSDANKRYELCAPLVPIYTSTTRIVDRYFDGMYKPAGRRMILNITGDCNNKVSYKVKVSGRYTS